MQVYQLYYNEQSKKNCFKESIHIECPNLTKESIWVTREFPLFENHKIIECSKEFNDTDKYGVLSHAFFNKARCNYDKLLQLSNMGSDIVTFNRIAKGRNILLHLDQYHGNGTSKLFIDLMEATNLPINKVSTVAYSNYFLARGDIYKDYVNTWLIPFCNEILSPKWDDRTYVNSNYKKAIREKGCDYPLHPFLIERLFSLYLANNNYKIIEQ